MEYAIIGAMAVLILAVYLFPYFIASNNGHSHPTLIFWLNLFFGWTFLVWMALLIWAFIGKNDEEPEVKKTFLNTTTIVETPRPKESPEDSLLKTSTFLKQMYELYNSGAITKEEYSKFKDEALGLNAF